MAVNLYTKYPLNTPAYDAEYPIGKARNDTFTGAKNGFPFEAGWANEVLGLLGAIQKTANGTLSGNPETATTSQYLEWLRSLEVLANKVVTASISTGAVTNSKLGYQAVTGDKVSPLAIDNSHLAADIQLDKISGGTLSLDSGGYNKLKASSTGLVFGAATGAEMSINGQGLKYQTLGAPGDLDVRNRWACYSVKDAMAAAAVSDMETRETSGHTHVIGKSWSVAIETDIPNNATLLGEASMSFSVLGTSGARRVAGAPVRIVTANGATTQQIVEIHVFTVAGALATYEPDTARGVFLTVYFDGKVLG